MKAALLLAALTMTACNMPEDTNPAQRCDADEMCPDGLACYRGFCLGTGEVLPDEESDAGVTLRTDASADAGVQSVATVHSVATDASLPIVEDLPSTPVSTVTTSSQPATVSPAPPVASAPATAMPTAVLPCVAQCTNVGDQTNACQSCVRDTFGGEPGKLCGSPAASFSVALATICELICTFDKNGEPKCDDSCHGKNCGGD